VEQAFFDNVNVFGNSNDNFVWDLSNDLARHSVSDGDHWHINMIVQTETQTTFLGSNLLVQKCNGFL